MPDASPVPSLLVVDDEPFALLVARRLAGLAGAERITTMSDPVAAVAHALDPDQAVALVLLDVEMPGMDGYGCVARLAAGGFPGAVAMLTGAEDLGAVMARAQAAAVGQDLRLLPALRKPVTVDALRAVLTTALRLG